jgi:glycosyltransferase involved in cell wall biosynthesis
MISYSEIAIIVPCKNESANILTLKELMGAFPAGLELILVEGGSNDDTAAQCQMMVQSFPSIVKFLSQTKKGKMNAVMEGIMQSSRCHIAIFDADLTVSWKDQLRLIDLYCKEDGKTFITGNRLNREMHKGSMQLANLIANYGFGLCFSILVRSRIKDTLCGTKIFPKNIVVNPLCKRIVEDDPFGDFSLISNAWLYGLSVKAVDVEYLPRRYGSTNIKRWNSGLRLVKIFITFALNHGKFNKNSGVTK